MIDLVVPARDCAPRCRKLLDAARRAEAARTAIAAERLPERRRRGAGHRRRASCGARDPWDVVQLARHPDRPHTLDYVGSLFDDFQELHGDRAVRRRRRRSSAGSARLGELHGDGRSATRRAARPREMMERNFGMPHPEGYRKALRLMRYAGASSACRSSPSSTRRAPIPARGRGARPVASRSPRASCEMSRLPVPIVDVVTGEGGSGGALALAVGDRVLMLENAYLLGDQPGGLRDDPLQGRRRRRRARPRRCASPPPTCCGSGVVDAVVPEPPGGRAHRPGDDRREPQDARSSTPEGAAAAVAESCSQQRYDRFRAVRRPGRAAGTSADPRRSMMTLTSRSPSNELSTSGRRRGT